MKSLEMEYLLCAEHSAEFFTCMTYLILPTTLYSSYYHHLHSVEEVIKAQRI